MKIAPLLEHHYPEVNSIYEQGIATGNATFETKGPTWDHWNKDHLPAPRLVALSEDGSVIGWAALSPVSGRCVYAGVAEVSVYIHSDFRGKGIAQTLLNELIRQSEELNIWTLQAGIFPENKVSLRLHEKCGFRVIGIREKIGQMKGIWRDIVFLERRSSRVGV